MFNIQRYMSVGLFNGTSLSVTQLIRANRDKIGPPLG